MARFHVPIILVPLVATAAAGGWFLFHEQKPTYQLATVTTGPISEQVLASGNTEASTTLALRFKQSGTLVAMNVVIGQKVKAGDTLARLDATALTANYNAAVAKLASARAALNKLLAGTSAQDVAVSESAKSSSDVSVNNATDALQNALATARTNLDAILSGTVNQLFKDTGGGTMQFGTFVTSGGTVYPVSAPNVIDRQHLNDLYAQVTSELATLESDSTTEDTLLTKASMTSTTLNDMATLLSLIADTLTTYTNPNEPAKSIYDGYRSANTAARSTIDTSASTLTAAVSAYQGALAAQDQAAAALAKTAAPARSEDVAAAEAAVNAAKAGVAAAEATLSDATIMAPNAGTVTDTVGDVGEVIDPTTPVVTLMSDSPLSIKANVSEDKILNVVVGDPVTITLDAFPSNTTFHGTVTKIDPAGTEISGAIYYKTTIKFDTNDPRIRPGMTTNVWIETGHATSTVLVPASALTQTATSTSVQVYQNGKTVPTTITTGLVGNNGLIEVTSGLTAGQQVVVGQ